MLEHFFQLGPIPANTMAGIYDPRLVLLSYLVATFASFIALDITGRLRDVGNTKAVALMWVVGGAIAMGAGIWSMHFIGMLSFNMPEMTFYYEPFWTGVSLAVAILASGFAFYLLKRRIINILILGFGGIILGLGIAAMHYTGMEAMKTEMDIHYLPGLFVASLLIAIFASEVALWLALKSNQVIARIRVRLKLISAFVMGIAICGMHYTGMAAAVFTPKKIPPHIHSSLSGMDPTLLAVVISGVTFIILGIAFFASMYKESINQKQLESARQLGMAEVASNILHNVGNVLNSVSVSTNLLSENIRKSPLASLPDINQLFIENKNDLAKFLNEDTRGIQLPNFINLLSQHWQDEQLLLTKELDTLSKNIELIKNIISMQQDLNKNIHMETIVDLHELIDEALFITGIELHTKDIQVKRHYEKMQPIKIDKVKLLQIIVNLLHNAKDALIESNQPNKQLTIHLKLINNKCEVGIHDNGIGIAKENLDKVFNYGFTTKTTGHGFGLHSSALTAKELGGALKATSMGHLQGATFLLEVPYQVPRR